MVTGSKGGATFCLPFRRTLTRVFTICNTCLHNVEYLQTILVSCVEEFLTKFKSEKEGIGLHWVSKKLTILPMLKTYKNSKQVLWSSRIYKFYCFHLKTIVYHWNLPKCKFLFRIRILLNLTGLRIRYCFYIVNVYLRIRFPCLSATIHLNLKKKIKFINKIWLPFIFFFFEVHC